MPTATCTGVRRAVVRYAASCSAAACAALLVSGCGSHSAKLAAGGAASPAAPKASTGPALAPAASTAPLAGSGKDACQYLTVDQVTTALKYTGTLNAGPRKVILANDSACEYSIPGDEDIPATLDIITDSRVYQAIKATWPTTGCKSAGIGDESIYCPDQSINPKPQVMFVKGGVVVLVTVTDPKVADWKAGDPVAAGLALGTIVAGEL
jgi:hypothetical protein